MIVGMRTYGAATVTLARHGARVDASLSLVVALHVSRDAGIKNSV